MQKTDNRHALHETRYAHGEKYPPRRFGSGFVVDRPISAAERNGIEIAASTHSELNGLCVQTKATGWSVSGRLRLLSDPLRHSNPGQIVLEAVDSDGRILAASNTVLYRVVTANPRERLFGFQGALVDGFPAGVALRVRHLPAGP